MTTDRTRYFADRLQANLDKAKAEAARIALLVQQFQEQGMDTSRFDRRTSAQSIDYTLAQAEARVQQAEKNLHQYLAAHPDLRKEN